MRLSSISCGIVALLSTSAALAETIQTPKASLSTADDYRAQVTPFPELVEDPAHLEIRQNLGVVPTAEQAPGQVPPVTVYTIATQVGATGVETVYTYTQLFSPVPDQWPSAKSGVIGYGTLHRKKREAEPVNTGIVEIEQPVVLVKEVEVVTVPLQRVTEVLVVRNVVVSNTTAINGTRQAPSEGRPSLLSSAAYRPLQSAAASGAVQATGLMH